MRVLVRGGAIAVWLLLAIVGSYGVYLRFTTGHVLTAYGNYIPWGLWVACYIYFIGLSAGAFVLSSVIYVGRVKSLAPLGPLALMTAAVTLVMAMLSIVMDLGHIERVFDVGLHANFGSMMAWMIFLYGAYLTVILAENLFALVPLLEGRQGDPWPTGFIARGITRIPKDFAEHWLHRLGVIGVPLAILFHGGVGALFATVGARPYWHQSLFPIVFLVGALVSGCALLAALYYLVWPIRDRAFRETMNLFGVMILGLLLFDLVLEWAEFSIPLWQGISHEAQIFFDLMYGNYWWNFWIIHLGFGVLVPLVLLLVGRRRPAVVALAGALIATTFLSVRLNLVIPPLTQPLVAGLAEAFVSPRASFQYFPSAIEWYVFFFVLAAGSAMLALAIRVLPLLPDGKQVGA
jgi:molybdopterin-containing oxidoreductase family membrane subunit